MNILYVKDKFGVHDRRFLKAIISQGHCPIAVQLNCREDPSVDLGQSVSYVSKLDLLEIIRAKNVDVVHVGPVPFACTLVEILPKKFPLIATSWGSDILLDCTLDAELKKNALLLLERANAILVDCQAVAQTISSWLPKLSAKMISFPWGVDLSRFRVLPRSLSREIREMLGWQSNDVFISTRSWEANYGIQSLLRAFAIVIRKWTTCRLLLVGDGSLRSDILDMVFSLGLSEYVYMPGRLDEQSLSQMYGAADIYVSSSFCDGSSISLLEAMANGKPVIVHNQFGNLDWVSHCENGWLADCRDPTKFADQILNALESKSYWESMGARGRELVFQKADWSQNSLLLGKAYQSALESAGL